MRRLNERIRQMSQEESTDEKIKEMKERVQYMDVVAGSKRGGSGAKGSGVPGGSAFDVYSTEVQARIYEAWRPPPSAKGDLLTIVTITIRKDGRISDWRIEQNSGSRLYDESVSRALRSVNDLPPLPPSVDDPLSLTFRFFPPKV